MEEIPVSVNSDNAVEESTLVEVTMEPTPTPTSSLIDIPFILEYGILKIIFDHLGVRDLFVGMRVCKLWHEVGKIVQKQRSNKPNVLLYHLYPVERTREVVELSNDFEVSDSTISWIEEANIVPEELEFRRNERTWRRTLCEDLEQKLWDTVDNQFSEPCQIICVGTHSLSPYLQLRKGESKSESSLAASKIDLFRRMGKVSPCIGVLGYGLVLTLPDNSYCLENECRSRERFLPMITGLVLPKVKGVKITTFSFGSDRSHSKSNKVTPENCEQFLNIQPEDNVRGIILFQTHQPCPGGENLLLSAVQKYLKKNPNVAFGGGLFNDAFTNTNSGNLIGCGLVISGDDNVRVGSTALLDVSMGEGSLSNLRKFKDAKMVGSKDYAFMFCCNGRGFMMHNAEHVESTAFRSEYPNVPLIGAFTGGEYFHPFVPGQSTPPPPPTTIKDLKFGYTTVFVYVSCR